MADRREQLDRQHRQHAGHEVEDEPAEQRQQKHDDEAAPRRWGRALRRLRDTAPFHRAPAIRQRQRELHPEHARELRAERMANNQKNNPIRDLLHLRRTTGLHRGDGRVRGNRMDTLKTIMTEVSP